MTKLKFILPKKSGRLRGKLTVRHQGGRQKRFLRDIDFKRSKKDVWARVEAIEYDPNRNCNVALICHQDGERVYIIAAHGLKVDDKVIASEAAPIQPGNALPLGKIPVGTQIHNLEINPGRGGQIIRSAGSVATVHGKDEKNVLIKLPSAEIRVFSPLCWATVGQVGNPEAKNEVIGKAGRKRKMGIKPTVRGIAQNPKTHPHGGGEGRSGVGMKHPKTPYGKKAVGKTRRRNKYSDLKIIEGRKRGPHVG